MDAAMATIPPTQETSYKGFSEYADVSPIDDHCIYQMILLVFGYRLVEGYLHTEDDDEKTKLVHTLQKI